MSLQSTLNLEAALFNEHVLAWEPLIEPTYDNGGSKLSPWGLTCNILPVSILLTIESFDKNKFEYETTFSPLFQDIDDDEYDRKTIYNVCC